MATNVPAPSASFVGVQGLQFTLDGKPFRFAGTNCYYLMQRLASEGNVNESLEVLDHAKELGLTVIRTWAFNDNGDWNPLQTAPGEYNENVFKALDRLLVECSQRGLRLMLCLTNYWKDYGGMQQYVRWSTDSNDVTSEMFYTDDVAKNMFRQYVSDVLLRTNSITGVQYRDDPTIMAWDIVNEPRCKGDQTGKIIAGWVDEVATLIKTIDNKHLVTFGSEGFFGDSKEVFLASNPFNAKDDGADFIREFKSKAIDFACIHLWHDQWIPNAKETGRRSSGRHWINIHDKACRMVLKKPLVVQEFGCKNGSDGQRLKWFSMVYTAIEQSWKAKGAIGGSCQWMLAARSIQDWDGYTVYRPNPDNNGPDPVITRIKQHVASIPKFDIPDIPNTPPVSNL